MSVLRADIDLGTPSQALTGLSSHGDDHCLSYVEPGGQLGLDRHGTARHML